MCNECNHPYHLDLSKYLVDMIIINDSLLKQELINEIEYIESIEFIVKNLKDEILSFKTLIK